MPNWTPQQSLAIAQSGCDLLVSASAGTGKTAVLTERIVRLAVEGATPVDLDRFLVVTFTDAAALEMRERIAAALRERLAREPGNSRVRHQCLLVEKAQISTLHSFCASLLRQHFHVLGLDPEFTTLDGMEAKALAGEVAQDLFDSRLETLEPVFARWLDTFSAANPELEARLVVLRVHGFLRKLDDPQEWTRRVRSEYPLGPDGEGTLLPVERCAWFEEWSRTFREEMEGTVNGLAALRGEARCADPKLSKWIEEFLPLLESVLEPCRRGQWREAVQEVREIKIPTLRGTPNADEAAQRLKERLKDLRDRFKKRVKDKMASVGLEEMQALHAASAWQIHLLLDLAWEFDRLYEAAKRQRGAVDFDDLEQLALRLLRGEENAPSKAAQLCQEQYEYVLVDEYQDINPVQEKILSLVSRLHDPVRPNNRFAVGDVKQSIYAFRLAAPDIFLGKYDAFPPLESVEGEQAVSFNGTVDACGRVDLSHNFRSRPEVLDFVNFVFERLMARETAGLDYGPGAALESGGVYADASDSEGRPRVELCLLEKPDIQTADDGADMTEEASETEETDANGEDGNDTADEGEDLEGAECEAFFVGRRILEMVEGAEPVQVAERQADGTLGARPARFRDVAVLLRSLSGVVDIYLRVFKQLGIPVFTEAGSGFLQAQEVRDVLNLLRVIDNPRQDIPLAALLGSPFEGWSESELLATRLNGPQGDFCEAVAATAQTESELGRKAGDFLSRLDEWRTRARRGPLADLLSALYEESGYPACVLAMENGTLRRANLERLYDLARKSDSFARQGLSRFLEFLDQIQDAKEDYDEAAVQGAAEDVVRIMTVHKSKGLEFPIVFVSNLSRKFNTMDFRGNLALDRSRGLGVSVVDVDRGAHYTSPAQEFIWNGRKKQALAEEMRVLYVALTRARERLVLSGTVTDLEKTRERWQGLADGARGDESRPGLKRLTAHQMNVAAPGGAMDWIGAALTLNPEVWCLHPAVPKPGETLLSLRQVDKRETGAWRLQSGARNAGDGSGAGTHEGRDGESAEQAAQAAMDRIEWTYPHTCLTRVPARMTTSELKRRMESVEADSGERLARVVRPFKGLRNPFVEGEAGASQSAGGVERGIVTHLVLQHLNLLEKLDYSGVSAQVDRLIDRGLLTEAQREGVDLAAVASFFQSPLGRRVLAQPLDRVWREAPFVLGLSPSEAGLPEMAGYDEAERIRVQGVLDCLVEEDDGFLLIDYKTDRIPPEAVAARVEYYRPQIRLYARAVEAIYSKPLKEGYLYFLHLGAAVPVWPE
jgi:ATP-dependent helicase/nuclease subunit A